MFMKIKLIIEILLNLIIWFITILIYFFTEIWKPAGHTAGKKAKAIYFII